jgi:hypothetical protein
MNDKSYYLRVTLLPILITIGIILSIISFLVMKRLRNFSTTSRYMAFLALSDSGVLFFGGMTNFINTILTQLNISFSYSLFCIFYCKFISFFLYTLTDLSVFIIVIMTSERFYAVWQPLKASKMSKKKKIKLNMIGACVLSALVNSHLLLTHTIASESSLLTAEQFKNQTLNLSGEEKVVAERFLTELKCMPIKLVEFYRHVWFYIDASIYSFIPSLLLIIFNFLIIKFLFKASSENNILNEYKRSKIKYYSNHNQNNSNNIQVVINNNNNNIANLVANRENPGRELSDSNPFILSKQITKSAESTTKLFSFRSYQTRYNTRITFMLIVLNISFCIFSMPISILSIYYNFILNDKRKNGVFPEMTDQEYYNLETLRAVAEIFQYLNHSTNFFLYTFSGKRFRDESLSFCKHHFEFFSPYFTSPKNDNKQNQISKKTKNKNKNEMRSNKINTNGSNNEQKEKQISPSVDN